VKRRGENRQKEEPKNERDRAKKKNNNVEKSLKFHEPAAEGGK